MTTSLTLWQNTADSVWALSTVQGAEYSNAPAFASTAGGYVVALRYFRISTTQTVPTSLKLWDTTSTATAVATVSSPGSAVGWNDSPLSSPVALAPGREYRVSAHWNTGARLPFAAKSARVAAPTPLIFSDHAKYYIQNGGDTYPNTVDEVNTLPVDIGWNDDGTPWAGAPPSGTTPPTTNQSLSDWLSSNATVQQHETDGLPWLTKVVADATKNAVDAGRIVIDATKAIVDQIPKASDPPWVTVQKLWQIAGVLTEAEIDLWNLFAKRAPGQLTGPTPGGGSAFFGPSGGQVAERAEVAGFNSELLWHRTRTTNWLEPVPGEDWELVDTLDWSGSVGWDQPADCYVIHITDWLPTWDEQLVAGHTWLPRAAWWAPLTGTLPHERHFVDFEHQVLHALPMRCEGILLCPREGFAGTLQAWMRVAPVP